MVLGTLTARLLVRESRTLKDKRQVVRSILDRVRSGFNVSAAEVDTHDDVKVATLAFAAVGFENAAVQNVLQQIAEALRKHPSRNTWAARRASGAKWSKALASGGRKPPVSS